MQGLLGKIVKITPLESGGSEPGLTRLQIEFKPACVMPARAAVPEWLADQTLMIERAVRDVREIGRLGESLVLTATESARWLAPLSVSPAASQGSVPSAVRLTLRWWKEEKAPEYVLRANGRQQTGSFAKEGEGEDWTAIVETAALFETPPALPVSLVVVCDKLTANCVVLPNDVPCHYQSMRPNGQAHHLENGWYEAEITGVQGGGLRSMREKSRDVDHFQHPPDLIQLPLFQAGHADRLRRGWNDESLSDVVATGGGARREGGTTRLTLEALVDEGQSLRTTVGYSLYDDLPLLLIQRDFHLGKPKEDDGKDKKPKEPINAMQPLGLSFRAASLAEREGATGSRLLCTDGDHLVTVRPAQPEEFHRYDHWRMTGGWGMVEHPRRRQYMLYLFDPQTPPHLACWSGAHSLTLEPFWQNVPVRPGEAVGFVLALTAGEQAGAGPEGAWVACRAARPLGGVRCALIGRLSDGRRDAVFTLGTTTATVPVQHALLPGVGRVAFAVADFPNGALSEPLITTVSDLPARRTP